MWGAGKMGSEMFSSLFAWISVWVDLQTVYCECVQNGSIWHEQKKTEEFSLRMTTATTTTIHFFIYGYPRNVAFVRSQWGTFAFHVYVLRCVVWLWIRIYNLCCLCLFLFVVLSARLSHAKHIPRERSLTFFDRITKRNEKEKLPWKLRVCRFPCIFLIVI